jgi:NAD-dependent protein deacetylase/lipoamidase
MAGAQIVIVNAEETAMDDLADAVIRGSIGEVLPELVGSGGPAPDADE